MVFSHCKSENTYQEGKGANLGTLCLKEKKGKKMFPIQIKYFDVNDVYAGGEDFWVMWKQSDDTDDKDGDEEDLGSK